MRTALLVCALTGAMFASSAHAATTVNGNLSVTANVAAACAVTASTAVAFGPYDPLATGATNGPGTVTVRCTKGTSADIGLNPGANATSTSCTALTRRMTNGTDFLPYALYSDSGRATVWGCDTTNDVTRVSTSSLTGFAFDVYGQIPAGADVGPGNYTDTVSVIVNF